MEEIEKKNLKNLIQSPEDLDNLIQVRIDQEKLFAFFTKWVEVIDGNIILREYTYGRIPSILLEKLTEKSFGQRFFESNIEVNSPNSKIYDKSRLNSVLDDYVENSTVVKIEYGDFIREISTLIPDRDYIFLIENLSEHLEIKMDIFSEEFNEKIRKKSRL